MFDLLSSVSKRFRSYCFRFGAAAATIKVTAAAVFLGTLAGCGTIASIPVPGTSLFSKMFRGPITPLPKGGGKRFVGNPYWKFGRYYVPHADPSYDHTGIASYISLSLHGNRTANGELEDTTALVAAHPTLPLPAIAEVTNLSNGCRIFLRLNDRGPFVPGRIIDMSPAAAKLLGFHGDGLARVRLRYWRPAPLDGDDTFEQQYLIRYPDLGCRKTRTSFASRAK